MTRSGRPARCGYHLCGSAATVRSAIASLPGASRPCRAGPAPERGRGQAAFMGQDGDRDRPAVAGLADHVAGRHPRAVQEHLVERRVPVHLAQRPDLHAGLAHRQREAADAGVLGHAGIGAGQQQAEVRGRGAGGPHLLPGDQPAAVAVRPGPGGQAGQVGPGARLAEELAPGELAGHGRPDQQPHELRGGIIEDRGDGEGHADALGRPGDTRLGQPGGHGRGGRRGQAAAAPLARRGRARPARVGQQLAPPGQAQPGVPVRRDPAPQLGLDLVGPLAGTAQRPSKRGGLRSAEARTPSAKSAVRRSRSCSASSAAIAAVTRSASPAR